MPQLDFFSIANQFTWGILYFVIFYFIVNNFIVPTIFASIFAREFLVKNSSTDGFENLSYIFAAFYLFNSTISNLTELVESASLDQNNSDFNNFVIVSKLVESEIYSAIVHNSFEDFDSILKA